MSTPPTIAGAGPYQEYALRFDDQRPHTGVQHKGLSKAVLRDGDKGRLRAGGKDDLLGLLRTWSGKDKKWGVGEGEGGGCWEDGLGDRQRLGGDGQSLGLLSSRCFRTPIEMIRMPAQTPAKA